MLSPGASDAREEALPGLFDLQQAHSRLPGAAAARQVRAATAHAGGVVVDRTIKLNHLIGGIIEAGRDDAERGATFVSVPGAAAEDDGVLLAHTLADDEAGSRLRVFDPSTLHKLAVVESRVGVPFGCLDIRAGT